jgi:hypothetical protein
VCDLCSNGLYWRQDSQYNLINVDIVKGTKQNKQS